MSASRCAACVHPEREAIDAALAFGWLSVRKLGAKYRLSKDQVWEHGRKHLTPALREAIRDRDERRSRVAKLEAETLVDRLDRLVDECEELLALARDSGQVDPRVAAIRELRATLALFGKATGELDDRPVIEVNLTASPEWAEVRSTILAALQPFPEAKAAVARALTGQPDAPAIEA